MPLAALLVTASAAAWSTSSTTAQPRGRFARRLERPRLCVASDAALGPLVAAAPWGYTSSGFASLPRFYGLVLLFNAVLPTLLVQFYLAFAVVGGARKQYGYSLPVMYPAGARTSEPESTCSTPTAHMHTYDMTI